MKVLQQKPANLSITGLIALLLLMVAMPLSANAAPQLPAPETEEESLRPNAQSSGWVINEILADPPNGSSGDANGDGSRDSSEDEFIEIVNNTGGDVDISGWTLSDDDGAGFTFPSNTVVPDQCAIVLFGGGTPSGDFGNALIFNAGGSISNNLANSSDTVIFSDGSTTQASYTYPDGNDNESLTRDPDITGSASLVRHSTATGSGGTDFSPGTQVDGTAFAGCPSPTTPTANLTYGSATVDGDSSEWDLAEDGSGDFFANMYRAGNDSKPIESKLYLRYDCSTETLYALVLSVNGRNGLAQPDDAFIKLGNSTKLVDGNDNNDGTPPDFAWVDQDGNDVQGFEAAASLAEGDYSNLNVHLQVFSDGESQTAAVANRAIPLTINCPEPGTITMQKVEDGDGDPENPNPRFTLFFTNGSNVTAGGPFFRDGNAPLSYENLPLDTYTFREVNIPEGWTLDDISCTSNKGTSTIGTFDANAGTLDVELAEGDQVDCVFTNSFTPPPGPGTIVIAKVTTDGDTTTEFDFTGDLGNFTLTGNSSDSFEVEPGTYAVSEVQNEGWQLTELNCDNGDTADAVTVGADEQVKCTFVNEPAPETTNVFVQKVVTGEGADSSQPFFIVYDSTDTNINPGAKFITADEGAVELFTDVPAGTFFRLNEQSIPENWTFEDVTCVSETGDTSFEYFNAQAQFSVAAGDNVTCTWTNGFTAPEPDTYELRMIKYDDLDLDGTNNELNTGAGDPQSGNALTGWEFVVYDSNGNEVGRNTTSVENAGANGDLGIRASIPGLISGEEYTICETQQEGWFNTEPGTINTTYGEPCETVTLTSSTTVTRYFGNREFAPDLRLNLTAECAVGDTLYWRVTNDEDVDIEFTWNGPGSNDGGPLTAKANDRTYFTTQDAGGANTTKINWDNPAGTPNQKTKAHNNEQCVYHVSFEKEWDGDAPDLDGATILTAESSLGTATCTSDDGALSCVYSTGDDLHVPFGETYTVNENVDGWKAVEGTGSGFTGIAGFDADALPDDLVYDVAADRFCESNPEAEFPYNLEKFCEHTVTNEQLLGKIIVNKFEDVNLDGRRQHGDNGEPGLANWEFTLYDSDGNQVGDSQTTGANGWTTFNDIVPGDYTICETLQEGWVSNNADDVSEGQACRDVTVGAGETVRNFRFANYRFGRIIAHKYEDVNLDGEKLNFGPDKEPGLADWLITLYDVEGTELASKSTGPNGYTNFFDLKPGSYTVCETMQDGWANSQPGTVNATFDAPCYQVVIDESGDIERPTFGNYELGSITIVKEANPTAAWLDWEFAGDVGDFMLDTDPDSDTPAEMSFDNLEPGSYTINETNLPSNWIVEISCESENSTVNPAGSNGITVELAVGDDVTCTFLNQRKPQIQITKYIQDGDNQTPGEGWEISLFRDGEQIQRTKTTPANGVVNFTSLEPGSYLVCETPQEDWQNVEPGDAAIEYDGLICQEVTVELGDNLPVSFVNEENRTGTLTILKYHDRKGNGTQDGNDPTLEGWHMTVTAQGELVVEGDTNDLGLISFELPAGDYVVCEENRPGWSNGCQQVTVTVEETTAIAFGNQKVNNILECVQANGDGSYTAYFGYENPTGGPLSVPYGDHNFLTGGGLSEAELMDQTPTEFGYPGVVPGRPGRSDYWPNAAFAVTFDGSPLVWNLLGSTETASANGIPCAYHVYFDKEWLDADGEPTDSPAELGDWNITTESSLGTASCSYDDGELVCEYENRSPALDNHGLWVPAGESYTVEENGLPTGWQLVSGTGEFAADSGECGYEGLGKKCLHVVVNQAEPPTGPGSLTIIKEASEDGEFAFFGDLGEFVLTDGGQTSAFEVEAGSYTVQEDPSSFPGPYWNLVTVTCVDGQGQDITGTAVSVDHGNFSAEITVAEGHDVICTFVNERADFEAPTTSSDSGTTIFLPIVVQ